MRNKHRGILLLLLCVYCFAFIPKLKVYAAPELKWIRPPSGPSYLLAGEEFEIIILGLDSTAKNLRMTHIVVKIGDAVDEPFLVIRFSNGSLKWVKNKHHKHLAINVNLSDPPQSIRLVGIVPPRFDSQAVLLISLLFFHGDTLVGEFHYDAPVFSKASAEAHKAYEKLRFFEAVVMGLVGIVALLAIVLVRRALVNSTSFSVLNRR